MGIDGTVAVQRRDRRRPRPRTATISRIILLECSSRSGPGYVTQICPRALSCARLPRRRFSPHWPLEQTWHMCTPSPHSTFALHAKFSRFPCLSLSGTKCRQPLRRAHSLLPHFSPGDVHCILAIRSVHARGPTPSTFVKKILLRRFSPILPVFSVAAVRPRRPRAIGAAEARQNRSRAKTSREPGGHRFSTG
jgi:hypothetical protein